MISPEEYERLRKRIESQQRKADEAKGAEKQLLTRLKTEYGCNSEEEAKDLLLKWSEEKEEIQGRFETALSRLEKTLRETDNVSNSDS